LKKKNLIYILFFLHFIVAFSQEKATISVQFTDVLITQALEKIEKTYNVRFSYQDSLLIGKKVTLKKADRTLYQVLEELSEETTVEFKNINERYIIVVASTNLERVQQLSDVIVTRYLTKGIYKNKDATFTINPKKLEILPGLIEADVLESIQLLPGVISHNETATGFTVRGGALDQNRIIWDGINMYHKGHLFGMISAFNPNVTRKVVFYNKGTKASFGERVSSVIDIYSENTISNNMNAGFGVNGINGDVYFEAPIIKDKLSVQASIRKSYTEIYQSPTFEKLAGKVFQNTKIDDIQNTNNDFSFLDYTLKINYKLNTNNSFYFSNIYIDNDLNYIVEDNDNTKKYNDILKIKNTGYGVGWNKIWNATISQKTQAFFSNYRLDYNYITIDNNEKTSDFEKRNEIYDSGLSSEVTIKIASKNELAFGYQYALKDVGYLFKETSDFAFILDADKRVINTHALYIQYNYKNVNLFNIDLGLRTNYFHELDAVRFEPRFLLYKEIVRNLKLQISGEIKNQILSEIDETILSDLSLENKLWRLADGETFPIINSLQVSTGFLFNSKGWSLDIDGYYKNIDGKTALSLGFLNPEDPSFHIGEQNIFGVDFYAKKDFNSIKTWISYSFSNVKSNYEDINNNNDFTAGTNIKHSFVGTIAYQKNKFQAALAWRWRTGQPYAEAIISPEDNIYSFIGVNTEVLPNYHRLDFSTTYDFKFSKKNKLKGKVGFSIRNVYNQKNHLSREYRGNNNLNDPIEVVDKYSLGFTPNFIFRAYW